MEGTVPFSLDLELGASAGNFHCRPDHEGEHCGYLPAGHQCCGAFGPRRQSRQVMRSTVKRFPGLVYPLTSEILLIILVIYFRTFIPVTA